MPEVRYPAGTGERFIFKLTGARCEITLERKSRHRWVSLPGGPHYVRTFQAEPHPSHYSKFCDKFKTDAQYRAQFKQEVIMAEQTNGNGAPLPEAPASATARMISPAGIEWLLTCRDHTVGSLITKVGQLEETLLKHNWQPAGGSRPSSQPAAAPAPADQAAQGEGWCTVHGQQMKWRSKPNEPGWWSHKATDPNGHEFWCRGK